MRDSVCIVAALACCAGCQVQNDPKPASIRQETVLFLAGMEIPASGTGEVTFPAVAGQRIYIEVDSIDPIAEPSFSVIRGDVSCEDDVADEDVIIDVPDDLRPGEAQDAFDPPATDTYTLCFTDDNNAPGETSYNVTITQDIG